MFYKIHTKHKKTTTLHSIECNFGCGVWWGREKYIGEKELHELSKYILLLGITFFTKVQN